MAFRVSRGAKFLQDLFGRTCRRNLGSYFRAGPHSDKGASAVTFMPLMPPVPSLPSKARLMSSTSGTKGELPEVQEVELPAGAPPVGDVSKEAGMEELLRAARGGGGGVRVSRRCHGCGAWLHSNNPEEHGYVPEETRDKFSLTGRRKQSAAPKGVPVETVPDGVEVMRDSSVKYKDKTRLLVCQRCYRLQNYHRLDTLVKGGFYRMEGGRDWEHEAEIVEKIVRRIRQYEECACYGKIRWGTSGRWVHVYPTSSTVANRLSCQVGKQPGGPDLVDVSPGDDTKHCECQVTTGSYFFHCINILALPRDQRKRLAVEEGSNCGIFAEDTSIAGRRLWKGVRGICNASLAKAAAGAKALPSKKLIQAVKTYVTLTFASNYKRFYESGWIKRGFVSYFSGPLEGAQSQSMELLIESVHRFSVYPIVVLHAGMATPLHWSPRVFPRLILLSVAELPLFIGHSITLLLAAVVSRVQTGILLNYNALVFPGVDNLFKETEREINAEYPYPIMPVHFMDKKASDGGTFWGHVEASGSSRQSMRWSHFGLFWTSHALPFLGTLLRGLLRDESYDAKAPYEPIKMRQLHDVESALNVALWTVGARKQWCKVDAPDLTEVEEWLKLDKGTCGDKSVCAPLLSDSRFYPHGIPKVFLSLRFGSDVKRTQAVLATVVARHKKKNMPDPILYYRNYRNGREVKKDWPDIPCLLGI
eukprot:symbB.v1.2.004352.t1/scaffold240.1/size264318/8